MKLKKIAVSGFKSFVDQTEVRFNTSLVGVVGPNGCGKSNVIDAVRWVMGESSAKMLRGDSMDDVIFNGSSTRKPVGRASVELHFDNALGRVKSHYQKFAQIVIKRVLNRDGQSEYRINDKRVRRKDVLDLFRGTGLGPRSYSIIEQGMVSRIVEAKPEELRNYVEEAAGISRYKDRRRETENRIRHTRENVERSEDIRDELLAQLRRLKRQAQAAKRYKKLQAKRRNMLSMNYRLRFDAFGDQIRAEKDALAKVDIQFEVLVSNQRENEANIESQRKEIGDSQVGVNDIQGEYYQARSEISSLEQKIAHLKTSRTQDSVALQEADGIADQLAQKQKDDQLTLARYIAELQDIAPLIDDKEQKLQQILLAHETTSAAFNQWQQSADTMVQRARSEKENRQYQVSLVDQLKRQKMRGQEKHIHLNEELATIKDDTSGQDEKALQRQLHQQQTQLTKLQVALTELQNEHDQSHQEDAQIKNDLYRQRSKSATLKARIEALQEFQAGAMASQNEASAQWLVQQGLDDAQQLAKILQIHKGWERAADSILAPYLDALVDAKGQHKFWLKPSEQAVTLINSAKLDNVDSHFELASLASVVMTKHIDIDTLLAGVYIAKDSEQALEHQVKLKPAERIVTQQGVVFGRNWVRHFAASTSDTGYLVREEELLSLQLQLDETKQALEALVDNEQKNQQRQKLASDQVRSNRQQQQPLQEYILQLQRQTDQLNATKVYANERQVAIKHEVDEILAHLTQEKQALQEAEQQLVKSDLQSKDSDAQKLEIDKQATSIKEKAAQNKQIHDTAQQAVQQLKLDQMRLQTSHNAMQVSLENLAHQIEQHQQRLVQLREKFNTSDAPIEKLTQDLQEKLKHHQGTEQKLSKARDQVAQLDAQLRQLQAKLTDSVTAVNKSREQKEAARLTLQSFTVRQQTLRDQATNDHINIDEVVLEEQIDLQQSVQTLEDLDRKIKTIGAVNLVAIEEYESQSERAEYLDKQHKDLLDALATLEKVIRKIDKETRVRFEQTYNDLNKAFIEYFPRLFGGGKASLQLTSDDWLTTGVTVMAQPPGKRNSTIHLLSGGEKALTAVSLLFALFQLNPAPFCMMDEVDAPLDDANVDRFCDTLKELSNNAQIIVITHNKITMQASNSLIGVTMHEPGVSRVVSVDIERALDMSDT